MAKKGKKQNRKKNQPRQNANLAKKKSLAADDDRPLIDEMDAKMQAVSLKPFISATATINQRPGGLQNLGNTCYFNSVMQVMGQTYVLHHLLKERCQPDFVWNAQTFYWKEKTQSFASESLHLKLPGPTSLILNFYQLQQQIFQGGSTNPRALFNVIQREKQQFEGYAQQDAQELLITLLDGLRKAEIYRQLKALIQGLKIDAKNPTEEEREKAKRYKITAKHTVIDAIFSGQLLSIIHCTVCDYRSFTFEPFTDLALSMSDKNCDYSPENDSNNEKCTNTPKKKKNKGGNKVKIESGDDGDEEQSAAVPQNRDDNDSPSFSLKNRKKKREEKKAARRAEKKRLQQQKAEKQEELPDPAQEEVLCNGLDEQSSDEETETCPVSYETSDDEEKEALIKQEIISTDDSEGKCSSENSDENSVEDDDDDDDEKEVKDTKISEDFRYKFYLFAHQRMSRTDDDYQNRDLGTLLRNFIKEETLDGSNKYLCERCSKAAGGQKVYSKAVRCQLIALPPPILILQLKRFEAYGGRRIASMHKLNSMVSFPEKLYLSPYTSRIYEYFSRFYEPECNPDDIADGNDERLEYTLYGVVIHSGSLRFGHYMAYVSVRFNDFECRTLRRFLHLKPFVSNIEHILQVVQEDLIKNQQERKEIKDPVDHESKDSVSEDQQQQQQKGSDQRKWFFISDSSVSAITMDSVLKDATSPYLLFYERTK